MPTNKEYVDLVSQGTFPEEVRVPLDFPFIDDRGIIQNLWLGGSGSITHITSKKGTNRANHYHQGDFHATYIISGEIKYTESNIDGTDKKEYAFKKGDMFMSPPMKWHRMEFLSDSEFITINGIVKSHDNYERSVVRIER